MPAPPLPVYGGSTLDNYEVLLSPRALRDLDAIYAYIADVLLEPTIADSLLNELESRILSLEQMPYRCPMRRIRAYANRAYRQLLIKNYTAIYRVDEEKKQVVIITVRYSRSNL